MHIITNFKIFENTQLADKYYFNTNKLDVADKEFIYSITNGDNTTKIISDMYFKLKDQWGFEEIKNDLFNIHKQLVEYNKNVFPIKGFDIYNKNNTVTYFIMEMRGKILNEMKQLPSIAIRNMKNDIRKERDYKEFSDYEHSLEYFLLLISQLSNRNDEIKESIFKKMFKTNTTIDDLIDFAEEKENLIGEITFTKDDLREIVSDYNSDLEIVYEKNNVVVVDVTSPHGIKKIGCNSLWCFTYGSGYDSAWKTWGNFSYKDHVYMIIDFNKTPNDSEFMYVLIKPLKNKYTEEDEDNQRLPLFDMVNIPVSSPIEVLDSLIGKTNFKKIFKFD